MDASLQMPFNSAQVEILKLFSQGLTDQQTEELRKLLIEFRFKLLDEHVVVAATAKGMTAKSIDEASKEHRRTAYEGKPKREK